MRPTAGQQFRADRHRGGLSWKAAGGPAIPSGGARAQSAVVRDRNTAKSDAQSHVWHVVTLTDGTKRELLATDPLDAIERVNRGEG